MTFSESLAFLWFFVMAELFKLRRARVAKATIMTMVLASPLITGLVWLVGDEKVSTFPRVLELIYLPAWLLTGLIGLLLAVEVMGSEFEQGTVRTVMGRGTPRWLFVGGKAVALPIALVVNAVVCVLCGGILAIISHLSQLGTTGLMEGLCEFARSCLPALGVFTLSGLAYVGILFPVVVLLRSSAPAMLVGLLVFGGDFIISEFGIEGIEPEAYSIYANASILFSRAVKVKDMQSLGLLAVKGIDDPGRAFLTLTSCAVVGVMLAGYILKRQDLVGKK
jgi:ABC-type transport system involved in multi-copper enzyme maturation permease subunit